METLRRANTAGLIAEVALPKGVILCYATTTMSELIGHKAIVTFFEKVMHHDALHHAYAFVGPEHVGKKAIVLALAAKLLDTTIEKLPMHPDITLVAQEKNTKTDKTKKHIDIEQIRALKGALSQYAAMGGYRIGIIDGAEKMNTSSSNALLKTLEEPGKKTVLFLIATDISQFLPTIRSRCQTIHVAPVSDACIEEALQADGIDADLAKEMAAAAHGLPGLARLWSTDRERYQSYLQTRAQFHNLFGKPYHEKLALVEKLFGDKTDHIQTRSALLETLGMWQIYVRDLMLTREGIQKGIGQPAVSIREVLSLFREIAYAKKYIQQNIHPKLLVEHILLTIP